MSVGYVETLEDVDTAEAYLRWRSRGSLYLSRPRERADFSRRLRQMLL
jgi:hypothetical protein